MLHKLESIDRIALMLVVRASYAVKFKINKKKLVLQGQSHRSVAVTKFLVAEEKKPLFSLQIY